MHGEGTLCKHTGEEIIGNFLDNKPEGVCKITGPSGWVYQGDMLKGKRNGQGVYEDTETGESYEGGWRDD